MSLTLDIDEYASIIATDRVAFTEEVFNQVGSGQYVDEWYVHAICEYLHAVELGQIDNLVVNMPPRCLKSITISIGWSAWLLGHNPALQMIAASHSGDIGKELNTKTLSMMQSDVYKRAFPAVELTKQTESWFKTSAQGHRLVATTGKSITGFGMDVLVIDDPLTPETSYSETERIKCNRWIAETLFNRANDLRKIKKVLVMQRLHEDDPAGKFIEAGWDKLILPAEFQKKTIIDIGSLHYEFEKGDLLSPTRLPKSKLDELQDSKLGLGPYGFGGQYLQTPAPVGGGEFKSRHIQYYLNNTRDFSAYGMNIYIIVDPASGKKSGSKNRSAMVAGDQDYTAMVVVGLHSDQNYYVLDLVRDRLNPTERIDKLFELHTKWRSTSGNTPKVVYEDYGMQSDIFYLEKAMKQKNYRFPLVKVGGRIKKEDRIRRLIPLFENQVIYLPTVINYTTIDGQRIELVKELIDNEMMTFPVGKHDDMLDAFARILDQEVYASFPMPTKQTFYPNRRSYADQLKSDFDEHNIMTW